MVIDCAHGATYHIAPNVLSELGAEVIAIGCDPNGININENAVQRMSVSYRNVFLLKARTSARHLTVTATA